MDTRVMWKLTALIVAFDIICWRNDCVQRVTSLVLSRRHRNIWPPSRSWSWNTSSSCRTRSTWSRRVRRRNSTTRLSSSFKVCLTCNWSCHPNRWQSAVCLKETVIVIASRMITNTRLSLIRKMVTSWCLHCTKLKTWRGLVWTACVKSY